MISPGESKEANESGIFKTPETWTLFAVGSVVALAIATALTLYVPRFVSMGKRKYASMSSAVARSGPQSTLSGAFFTPPRHASKS